MKIRMMLAALLPIAFLSPTLGDDGVKGYGKLEDLLPGDASVVILVEDASTLQAKWDATPMAKTWADAAVQKFFAPSLQKFEEGVTRRAGAGESVGLLKEFRDLLQGQAAVCLSGDLSWIEDVHRGSQAPAPVEQEGDGPQPPTMTESVEPIDPQPRSPHGVFVGGIKDPAGWMKFIARVQEKRGDKETTEAFQGLTLHVSRQAVWTLVGKTAVMGFPKAEVEKAASALKKGSVASPLSAHPTFQKVRKLCPKSDVLLYVNLEPWASLGKKRLAEVAPMMGADPEALSTALGLDVLRGAFLSVLCEPAASAMDSGILFSENRGLVRLLAFQEGAAPKPAFLPAEALAFSTSRFSLPAFVDGLLDIAKGASPMAAAMIDMQLAKFTKDSGVDLKKDLVGNLGAETHTASLLLHEEEGKPVDLARVDQFFAVPLVDPKAFEAALDKALLAATRAPAGADPEPLFDIRDYLGNAVHVLRKPVPNAEGVAQQVQYVVVDRWLLVSVGQGGSLEAALAQIAKPGKSAWDRPEVKAALGVLPEGASGLGYSDLGVLAGGWFDAMASAQAGPLGMMGGGGFCDPTAKPDPKAIGKFWGPCVTAQYRSADGLVFRTRLLNPK